MNTTLGDVVNLIYRPPEHFPGGQQDGTLLGIVQLDDLRADMFSPEKYGTTIDRYMIAPPDLI